MPLIGISKKISILMLDNNWIKKNTFFMHLFNVNRKQNKKFYSFHLQLIKSTIPPPQHCTKKKPTILFLLVLAWIIDSTVEYYMRLLDDRSL